MSLDSLAVSGRLPYPQRSADLRTYWIFSSWVVSSYILFLRSYRFCVSTLARNKFHSSPLWREPNKSTPKEWSWLMKVVIIFVMPSTICLAGGSVVDTWDAAFGLQICSLNAGTGDFESISAHGRNSNGRFCINLYPNRLETLNTDGTRVLGQPITTIKYAPEIDYGRTGASQGSRMFSMWRPATKEDEMVENLVKLIVFFTRIISTPLQIRVLMCQLDYCSRESWHCFQDQHR